MLVPPEQLQLHSIVVRCRVDCLELVDPLLRSQLATYRSDFFVYTVHLLYLLELCALDRSLGLLGLATPTF